MCRELDVNGSIAPVFHTDDFILKVTVAKVTEKLPENNGKVTEKLPENNGKVTEKLPENAKKLPENSGKLTEKLPVNRQGIIDRIIQKANSNGEKLIVSAKRYHHSGVSGTIVSLEAVPL